MSTASGRTRAIWVTGALAVLAAGCGGEDAGDVSPAPAPIRITASISADRVSVTPERFGPGPVSLVVTNLTDSAQQVTLRADGGAALRQQTAPINPRDTATLRADMDQGRYTVGVRADRIMPARLLVAARDAQRGKDRLQP
jgi:predicted component of type VI protein secretion system